MSLWYYEQLSHGRWWPRTVDARPDTKTVAGRERIRTGTGLGPVVRGVKEVPGRMSQLTLDELAQLMGTASAQGGDGR